jgi:flagellar basal-body rod modification protein FlgD
MSVTVPPVGQQGQQATSQDPLSNIQMSQFIQMLVAELTQQDPTQPVDNSQILQQVSQIQSIESTQQLSSTLQSVALGQNLSTGSNLLGHTIVAMDDDGQQVMGQVTGVVVQNGVTKIQVGNSVIDLKNIWQIEDNTSANTSSILSALSQLLGGGAATGS